MSALSIPSFGTREEVIPLKAPAADITVAQYDSINNGSGGGTKAMMTSTSNTSLKSSQRSLTHMVPSRDIAKSINRVSTMAILGIATMLALGVLYGLNMGQTLHKQQPIGPYRLISRQEGEDFFQNYIFYEGKDSAGSNGYVTYVSKEKAEKEGIVKLVTDPDEYTTDENGNASLKSESNELGDSIPAPQEETVSVIVQRTAESSSIARIVMSRFSHCTYVFIETFPFP